MIKHCTTNQQGLRPYANCKFNWEQATVYESLTQSSTLGLRESSQARTATCTLTYRMVQHSTEGVNTSIPVNWVPDYMHDELVPNAIEGYAPLLEPCWEKIED